ncbi:MAG: two pore domain potassium channel family protein [Bacteroidales bacterium]|nr:two pore domain potassium channel family protein [Bacteroidales bacterium]
MTHRFYHSINFWNGVLVFSAIFAAFILPVLPPWHRVIFRIVYSLIYFSALYSLKQRSKKLITLFLVTLTMEWISGILDAEILLHIAQGLNILFFIVIVTLLIRQIANEREVNTRLIFGSIAGYLLIGIIFSIFTAVIIQIDPGAFNIASDEVRQMNQSLKMSVSNYWVFITMGTLGYGDILPLKPYTRSLSTFIVIFGQFYIAIIVAMLVGKFAAGRYESTNPADRS